MARGQIPNSAFSRVVPAPVLVFVFVLVLLPVSDPAVVLLATAPRPSFLPAAGDVESPSLPPHGTRLTTIPRIHV